MRIYRHTNIQICEYTDIWSHACMDIRRCTHYYFTFTFKTSHCYYTITCLWLHQEHTDIWTHGHTHVQTFGRANILAYESTDMRTFGHTDVRTCIHSDIRTYEHTNLRTNGRTHVQPYGAVDIQAYKHTKYSGIKIRTNMEIRGRQTLWEMNDILNM